MSKFVNYIYLIEINSNSMIIIRLTRHNIIPSSKMFKDLENKCLILSNDDIGEEEIRLLIPFIQSNVAIKCIETLVLNKIGGDIAHNDRGRNCVLKKCDKGAFAWNGNKLMKEVIMFITKAKKLHSIIIDSVKLPPELLPAFGNALSQTTSELRWFSAKNSFIGDKGLKVLAPHLRKVAIQVLILERVGLTDACLAFIVSILKAQEAILDSLYWNATLRIDMTDAASIVAEDMNCLYGAGLVAVSLAGNDLTGSEFINLSKNLSKNQWLLGLNLSHNRISEASLSEMVVAINNNDTLTALVVDGNPGLSSRAAKESYDHMSGSKGRERIDLLPDGVALLLRRWLKLQRNYSERSATDDYSFDEEPKHLQRSNGTANLWANTPPEEVLRTLDNYGSNIHDRLSSDPENQDDEIDVSWVKKVEEHQDSDVLLEDYERQFKTKHREVQKNEHGLAEETKDDFDRAIPSPNAGSSSLDLTSSAQKDSDGSYSRPPSRISLRPRAHQIYEALGADFYTSDPNYQGVTSPEKGEEGNEFDNYEVKRKIRPKSAPVSKSLTTSAELKNIYRPSFRGRVVSNVRKSAPESIPSSRLFHSRTDIELAYSKNSKSTKSISKAKVITEKKSKKKGSKKLVTQKTFEKVMEQFSSTILNITKNLEHVSSNLQVLTTSLSDVVSKDNSFNSEDRANISVNGINRRYSPSKQLHDDGVTSSQDLSDLDLTAAIRQTMKNKLNSYIDA